MIIINTIDLKDLKLLICFYPCKFY